MKTLSVMKKKGSTKQYVLALLMVLACAGWANAATLSSAKNTETDMKDYQAYICLTAGCTVVKSAAMLLTPPIPQPATGRPSIVVDLSGREGAFAFTARDLSLNESVLSVQTPFDFKAPAAPTDPQLLP